MTRALLTLSTMLAFVACNGDDPKDTTDDPADTDTDTDTDTGDTGSPLFPTQAQFDAFVAATIAKAEGAGVAGFQVAIAVDGDVVHTASWGQRDTRTGEPITDQTRFNLASVSKMFAAAAAYDLQEDGLLDLDAPVTDVAPDFVLASGYDASQLTTRMGLNHTSGLPDWVWLGADFESYEAMWADAELPLLTPPGMVSNYSNGGYAMASHAVSSASGKPFADVVDERIVGPLGLSLTYDIDEVLAGDFAHGHDLSDANATYPIISENWGGLVTEAAGGMWGTATDVATFLAALEAGTGPLDTASYADMQGGQSSQYCGLASYGAGLQTMVDPVSGHTLVEHAGYLAGFQNYAMVVPELGIVMVVLVNDYGGPYTDFWVWEGLWMFEGIEAEATWPPVETEPDDVGLFAGRYVHVDGNRVPFSEPQWWSGAPAWSYSDVGVQKGELLLELDGVPIPESLFQHNINNCWEVQVPGWGTEYVEFWPNGLGGYDWLVSRSLGSAVREGLVLPPSMTTRTVAAPAPWKRVQPGVLGPKHLPRRR